MLVHNSLEKHANARINGEALIDISALYHVTAVPLEFLQKIRIYLGNGLKGDIHEVG